MEYDNVEKLLNKRQEIINELASLSYSSEEFKEVVRDINLLELNKKAVNLISKNRLELRNKMNSIAKGKAARKSYDSNFYESIKKFSKKV
ncbi:hypothetical protein GOM49_08130 [Clostridium bovifaecis]|uniref:Flagellar protein FliT n=1 Tax=Clostridium bovifaecis TaxID=2184719 RepID=A0A6I6EXQ8_9CLOT|nr:hypothetical protein GOM49_08130 [Clostridium bovifaecis]